MQHKNEVIAQLHKAALLVRKAEEKHPDLEDNYHHLLTGPSETQAATLTHLVRPSLYRTSE